MANALDGAKVAPTPPQDRIGISAFPYFGVHILAVVGIFLIPFNPWAAAFGVFAYIIRMFGITAGYHRYFAHRSYKTSRAFQFVLGLLGTLASQKGVLWWSGHHRDHHRYSDTEKDIHSPKRGFWWSHQTWFLVPRFNETPASQLREFKKYPEILWLNRFWYVPPVSAAVLLYIVGGLEWFFWGGIVSTTLLYHGTFTINSLSHVWGSRRYETTDTSRNNFVLALITLGEGWHNNHHHYQSTACQGFFWWELDVSYQILKVLSWFGIVWDLRRPPDWVLAGETRRSTADSSETAVNLPPELNLAFQGFQAARAQWSAFIVGHRREADASTGEAQGSEPSESGISEARTRLAKSASEAAERAAEVAREAADASANYASGLSVRLVEGKARLAQRAAEIARDASDSAHEMAQALSDRVADAWAETARTAARTAEEAAQAAGAAAQSANLGSPLAAHAGVRSV
jgi:stearoyl-CoA desaturase (Delta-9 desaturase)